MAIDKTFTSAKQEFDAKFENSKEFECFLPEHLTFKKKNSIKNKTIKSYKVGGRIFISKKEIKGILNI